MNDRELRARLDRLGAALKIHATQDVALNDGTHHRARTVLERMGLDPEGESCRILLRPIKDSGLQRLLMKQPIGIRAAAQGAIKRKRIRDGS